MKKLFAFISGSVAYLSFPIAVLADPTPTPTPVLPTPTPVPGGVNPCENATDQIIKTLCQLGGANGIGSIAGTIRGAVVLFVVLAIVIALLYLLYGGLRWITSGGEKEKVDEARKHIIAAIVGLIVVFLAIFILAIILAAFGIQFSDLKIPTIGGA